MGYAGEQTSNYKGKKPYKYEASSKKARTFAEGMGKPKMTFDDPDKSTLKMRPGKSSAEYNKAREDVGGTIGEQKQLQRKNNVVKSLPNNPGGPVRSPSKLKPADRQAAMGRMLGR